MADVNFTLSEIQDFELKMNDVSYNMNSRLDNVDSAVFTLKNLVSEISNIASGSLATMVNDRSVAYHVRSTNNKRLEEINSELGNLRNSNTEGCNDSAIKSKEREYNEVKNKVRQLDDIISRIDSLSRMMESNVSNLKNQLYKVESAYSRFKKCFSENGPQGKIQELSRKAKSAQNLGVKAFYHLALNDKNSGSTSERLTILNIDSLRNTSNAVAEKQKQMSNLGQEMLKRSHGYSEMMQSEIMRNSFDVSKEMFSEGESYSKFLGKVSNCLKDAYSVLQSYMGLI